MKNIKGKRLYLMLAVAAFLAFYFCLPKPLFDVPYSQVLYDSKGNLLSAKVAKDEQWRFEPPDSIPQKFEKAILQFEDRRFYYHPGVDPISLVRAIIQNIRGGRVVSGASTLTMQVIRLSRNKPRTILEKLKEFVLAVRLECRYSKKDILNLYAAHAPFGGNVVGLETACWRYFKRSMYQLSWSEACFLAVLPNSPSMLHPGKNRTALTEKRNRLLTRLLQKGIIDTETHQLAMEEQIPVAPKSLPQEALHLLNYVSQHSNSLFSSNAPKSTFHSHIKAVIQKRIDKILRVHNNHLSRNGVYNMAAMVVDLEGRLISYHGNVSPPKAKYAPSVDIIHAQRSTGSIIKPFLYSLSVQRAIQMPHGLVQDVPIYYNGYSPQNASHEYEGMVPYNEALIKSLNIPFVNSLKNYGVERFLAELKGLGFESFDKPANHYGLTLILGGGEVTLHELVQQYLNMARTVKNYTTREGRYCQEDIAPIEYLKHNHSHEEASSCSPTDKIIYMDAGAIFHTLESMKNVVRPESEGNWKHFNSSYPIAWKTGTSFGSKDAWAVGLHPDYIVGVWVGNADGEGRPGISGIQAAAPVLFDIFDVLPLEQGFFEPPLNAMLALPICQSSGYRAHKYCPQVDTILMASCLSEGLRCPFHKEIFLDPATGLRVNSSCHEVFDMRKDTIFDIPAFPFHYYKKHHPELHQAPLFKEGCRQATSTFNIAYPFEGAHLYLPKDLDGEMRPLIAKAYHENEAMHLFWHLDENYLGQTKGDHSMEIQVPRGTYQLKIVDENGEERKVQFDILQKK